MTPHASKRKIHIRKVIKRQLQITYQRYVGLSASQLPSFISPASSNKSLGGRGGRPGLASLSPARVPDLRGCGGGGGVVIPFRSRLITGEVAVGRRAGSAKPG